MSLLGSAERREKGLQGSSPAERAAPGPPCATPHAAAMLTRPGPPLRALRSVTCAAAATTRGRRELEGRRAGGFPSRAGGPRRPPGRRGWESPWGTRPRPLRAPARLLFTAAPFIPTPGAGRGNAIKRLSLEEMRRWKGGRGPSRGAHAVQGPSSGSEGPGRVPRSEQSWGGRQGAGTELGAE